MAVGMNDLITQLTQYLLAPYAWLELLSMSCGLLGSFLLALKGRHAPWGWVLFAASNVGWIAFAEGNGHKFLLIQQIGFSITSAIGIWHYLVNPWCQRKCAQCCIE